MILALDRLAQRHPTIAAEAQRLARQYRQPITVRLTAPGADLLLGIPASTERGTFCIVAPEGG